MLFCVVNKVNMTRQWHGSHIQNSQFMISQFILETVNRHEGEPKLGGHQIFDGLRRVYFDDLT